MTVARGLTIMMTNEPWPMRVARILPLHGLSVPEYHLMCTAGYRVCLDRWTFVEHARLEFDGSGWPDVTRAELVSALSRLLDARLLMILTDSDVQTEQQRRAASDLPELDDGVYYRPGQVDFTGRGYFVYRGVIREIHGDEFLLKNAGEFNLDSDDGRFDVYSVSLADCQRLMDEIHADADAYTGTEGATFIGKDGPTQIGEWRPNRFVRCAVGFHGVLRYVSDPARPAVAADAVAPPRR